MIFGRGVRTVAYRTWYNYYDGRGDCARRENCFQVRFHCMQTRSHFGTSNGFEHFSSGRPIDNFRSFNCKFFFFFHPDETQTANTHYIIRVHICSKVIWVKYVSLMQSTGTVLTVKLLNYELLNLSQNAFH